MVTRISVAQRLGDHEAHSTATRHASAGQQGNSVESIIDSYSRRARIGRKLLVQAYGEMKPRSVAQNLPKLLSTRWNVLLKVSASNSPTHMHDTKAGEIVTQGMNAGVVDPLGSNVL